MQLQPILLSMNNLMSGRLFRIPEYQRAYAWGKKQDDIMAAAKLTIVDDDILNEHFFAPVPDQGQSRRWHDQICAQQEVLD